MIKKKTLKKLGFKNNYDEEYYYLNVLSNDSENTFTISFTPYNKYGVIGLFINDSQVNARELNITTKKELKQLLKLLNV